MRVQLTNGEVTMEDLGSRNGTFVDGEPIAGAVPPPRRCARAARRVDDLQRVLAEAGYARGRGSPVQGVRPFPSLGCALTEGCSLVTRR